MKLASVIKSSASRVFGAIALASLGWYLQNLPGEVATLEIKQPEVSLLVLNQDLTSGQAITTGMLSSHSFLATHAPHSAVPSHQLEQLSGLNARRPLSAGQILTLHDLKARPSEPVQGASVSLPAEQIEGLEQLKEARRADLYGSGIQVRRALLTPKGSRVHIRVQASQRDQLAILARGSITALECVGEECLPQLKVIKTQKVTPQKRRALQVSYGFES